jgi:hypothetical protein
MPRYKVVVHNRDAVEEEKGLPIQFNVNGMRVSIMPGKEVEISETTLENLRRAIIEKPVYDDKGEIVPGKKEPFERFPVIVIDTIYTDKELKAMEKKKKEAAA